MYGHSYVLLGGHEPSVYIFSNLDPSYFAVNFFFFLSGYLMYSALLRTKNLIEFLINRLSRIIPGLVVCVGLTLILGYTVTSYSAAEYFGSLGFFNYFRNAVFIFTPSLPGVFDDNPYPNVVNGSLWTLFYEVACYVALAILVVFDQKTRSIIISLLIILCIACLAFVEYIGPTLMNNIARLSLLFFAGYMFASQCLRGKYYVSLIILLLAYYYLAQHLEPMTGGLLVTIVICSFLLDLALRLDRYFPPVPFDVSYGVYIYAFPIQQLLIYLVLELSAIQLFIYSIILTFPLAVISWLFVEKPGMKRIRGFKNIGVKLLP